MIEATADTILPTPSGLVVGLTLKDSKSGWVKFCRLDVPWSLMTYEVARSAAEYADRERATAQHDAPLW